MNKKQAKKRERILAWGLASLAVLCIAALASMWEAVNTMERIESRMLAHGGEVAAKADSLAESRQRETAELERIGDVIRPKFGR